MDLAADNALLKAWVIGRSLARGLPHPVADRGGLRVDTASEVETCRWIFPLISPGLVALASTVKRPGYLLKACGSADDLRAALPFHWHVEPTGYVMRSTGRWTGLELPPGYTIATERNAVVTQVEVRSSSGALAASGYAAETEDAFVYDRIVTAPQHRRRGLGRAVMSALRETCGDDRLPHLLVATDDGRALYQTLGWQTLCPYSTAAILAD